MSNFSNSTCDHLYMRAFFFRDETRENSFEGKNGYSVNLFYLIYSYKNIYHSYTFPPRRTSAIFVMHSGSYSPIYTRF